MNWEKICKVNDKKYMYIFYSIFAVIIVGVIIASINFSYLKLTKKQQQELIELLKFTPITVTLQIQGYGGECYSGRVDRKDYEFFKKLEEDYRRKRGLDKLTKQAQELDMGYPKE